MTGDYKHWQPDAVSAPSVKPIMYVSFSECGQFIRFWTRSKMDMQAQKLARPDMQFLELFGGPQTVKDSLTAQSATSVPEEWREAMADMLSIIESAGIMNLANGVQLGQVSWAVKMTDACNYARALLQSAEVFHD